MCVCNVIVVKTCCTCVRVGANEGHFTAGNYRKKIKRVLTEGMLVE